MNFLNSFFWFLIIIFFTNSCYKEQITFAPIPNEELELPLILAFDHKDCFFDSESGHFCFSIPEDSILNFAPFVQFQEYSTIRMNDILLTNNAINNLGTIKIKEVYTLSITTQDITTDFTLHFTILPTVRVISHNKILNDPQLLARLTINSPISDIPKMTSFVAIDLRGTSSQLNPKKSYGFTFLEGMDIKNKASKSVFDWKENEDWILDAVYNDQAKFRNQLSFEIWEAMNPAEHISIKSQFVELYLNNSYQGLYCLNEQINPEQLGLLNSDGVLYKTITWNSSTRLESLSANQPPAYTELWEGWEQKYPHPSSQIKWHPLYDLRNWVANENDQQFIDNVSTYIDLENVIDYYLFINLIGAFDNHGKNMFWVSFNVDAPFSIIPWDIDASWGRDWDKEPLFPIRIETNDNELFDRLLTLNPNNFKGQLQDKWNMLRANAWSNNSIKMLVDEKFELLMKTDVIQLENARWGTNLDLYQERIYIHNWMIEQFNFLDNYVNNL